MTLASADLDAAPLSGDFARAVVEGLSARDKHIPCRFLYDARGSALFEEITGLEEYYPTRTEIGLLEAHGPEIAALAGPGCAVVEFGSGSGRKTRILLEHLEAPAAYVPIEIDATALAESAARLAQAFPDLALHPVRGDFSKAITLPEAVERLPTLAFFPGSTIGNFDEAGAIDFLARAAALVGPGGALLIGADLRKDLAVLLPAYDDAKGVTAAFILNVLTRVNRELEGTLDVGGFAHRTLYNEQAGRIEIYLESLVDQSAEILGRRFAFAHGERIHIENSHKYTVPEFQGMARQAGWRPEQVWRDARDWFSLHYLIHPDDG